MGGNAFEWKAMAVQKRAVLLHRKAIGDASQVITNLNNLAHVGCSQEGSRPGISDFQLQFRIGL